MIIPELVEPGMVEWPTKIGTFGTFRVSDGSNGEFKHCHYGWNTNLDHEDVSSVYLGEGELAESTLSILGAFTLPIGYWIVVDVNLTFDGKINSVTTIESRGSIEAGVSYYLVQYMNYGR